MSDRAKWLAGLQAGDPVVLVSTYDNVRHWQQIAHVTEKSFVTRKQKRYLRSNGRGYKRANRHCSIDQPTARELRLIESGNTGCTIAWASATGAEARKAKAGKVGP